MSTGAAPDLPPHAYVPGQTPRHDASRFAALHGSVRPGMDAEALARTEAWRAGLHFLRAGYFWEAHEALEPVWMQIAPNSPARHLVQALIQAANAGLKLRMRRPRATLRLCDLAAAHLAGCGAGPVMGLDPADLEPVIAGFRHEAQTQLAKNAI